jgi:hypothetical protein
VRLRSAIEVPHEAGDAVAKGRLRRQQAHDHEGLVRKVKKVSGVCQNAVIY